MTPTSATGDGARAMASSPSSGCATNCRARTQSRLIEQPVARRPDRARRGRRPGDTAFAAAVAAYGQLLRGDTNLGRFSFADARALAQRAADDDYWRQEFVGLTELAERRRFARPRTAADDD